MEKTNVNPDERQRILSAMEEGAKLSLMAAGPTVAAGNAIDITRPKSLWSVLERADEPKELLQKLSGDIATTAPVKIPHNAEITPQIKKNGYYHMRYKWTDDNGIKYEARWHTRNPTAPKNQKDTWVVERRIPGIGYGKNRRDGIHQYFVEKNRWVTKKEWDNAKTARRKGNITEEQEMILKNGHWKA